jgi:hypothetical protein
MLFAAVKQLKRRTKSCSINRIESKTYHLISRYMETNKTHSNFVLEDVTKLQCMLSGRRLEESDGKFCYEFELASWLQGKSN